MIIAVDFDGTIVQDRYPAIGSELPFATQTLRMLMEDGHRLILWTVRQGDTLADAVEWCRQRGVEFYAVNKDFPEENEQSNTSYSRKIKADIFIDDRNVGGLPDWGVIYQMIHDQKTYEEIMLEGAGQASREKPRKKWWQI